MGKEKISYKSAKTVCAAGKKLLAGRCESVPNGRGSKYRPIARTGHCGQCRCFCRRFSAFSRDLYAAKASNRNFLL